MPAKNLRLASLASVVLPALSGCADEGRDHSPPPAAAAFTVGGTVSGLVSAGLVLQLNGTGNLPVIGSGPFVFATALLSTASYTVTVAAQPGGQICTISGGSGAIAGANVTDVAVTCAMALVPLFADDFDRPDQPGLGATPDGQVWLMTGPGYLNMAIEDGRYVGGPPELDNNVSYAGILMNEQPLRLGGRFSFVPSGTGGSHEPVVALISSNDVVFTLRRMVHLIAGRRGVVLTWWQERDQNNLPAQCQGSTDFAAPLPNDGTSHPLYMTIRGDTVTVDKPDGTQLVCTDPHFPQLAGTLGIWELAYDRTAADVPRWDRAEAFVEAVR